MNLHWVQLPAFVCADLFRYVWYLTRWALAKQFCLASLSTIICQDFLMAFTCKTSLKQFSSCLQECWNLGSPCSCPFMSGSYLALEHCEMINHCRRRSFSLPVIAPSASALFSWRTTLFDLAPCKADFFFVTYDDARMLSKNPKETSKFGLV